MKPGAAPSKREALRLRQRRRFRFRAPQAEPSSGAASQLGLLLGVVDGGARGVTLEVWSPGEGVEGLIALSAGVADTWRQAQAVARRFAPAILADGRDEALPCLRTDANVTLVSGPSYGLSFVLLGVSALIDQSVPSDVVATAIVDDHGGLQRVDGLRAKIAALVDETEGVHRLFVAQVQEDEAKATVKDLGCADRVHIHGCRDVRAVCDAVFEGFWDALGLRWQADLDGAAEVARRLLVTMVRSGAGFVALDACVRMARALEGVLEREGRPEAWYAQTAGRLAERYQGVTPDPIVVPPSIQLHPVLRLELMAHQIQACTERCDQREAEGWLARLEASDLAPICEADEKELRVYGALARLRASWGELEPALRDLLAIADAWIALDMPKEVSHAACEALRIAALLGDDAAYQRADRALDVCYSVANAVSRAYIAMSRARGASLRGADGAPFVADDAEAWVACGERVDAQRRRFQVMCHCDAGRHADAHRALASLLDFEGDVEVQRALALAHLALAEQRGVQDALDAVASRCAKEVQRLKTWRPEVETDLAELLRWLRL